MSRISSSSRRLPIVINGLITPALWMENCPDGQPIHSALLDMVPAYSKDWCDDALAGIAPLLTSVCCRPEDGASCGQAGQVPGACSLDCAQLLVPFSAQCPSLLTQLGVLSDFLVGTCGPVIAGMTVAAETSVVQINGIHAVPFDASAGTRYEVTLRVGEGSGSASMCISNFYDLNHGDGSCDSMIRTGAFEGCANDLAPGGSWEHYCDRACGITCPENGVLATKLIIHAPGDEVTSPGVTSESTVVEDKTLGFAAATTGHYSALIIASGGSGPVTTTITAVGTALGRSPAVIADGEPHPLHVLCETNDCTFKYGGIPAVDGDGRSFDLHLTVEAGISYSLQVEHTSGAGADILATFYQPDAAESAAGFADVLSGALGSWSPTPPGHHSIAEHWSCDNEDRSCVASWLGHPFGIHPGGVYGSSMRSNFVAPASGPVLLRIAINCDVPFFSDVELDGCMIGAAGSDDYGCDRKELQSCVSDLTLTVTPGAHFTVDQESTAELDAQVGSMLPSPGPAQSISRIVVGRTELEAQAASMLSQQPNPVLVNPPTLDEMLVDGSEANALLQSMLTREQQPHLVYPLQIDLADPAGGKGGGGHRRLQRTGDTVSVRVLTRAPTAEEAELAVTSTATQRGGSIVGAGRRLQDCSPPPSPPPPVVVPPSTFQAPIAPITPPSSTVCGLGGGESEMDAQAGAMLGFQGCSVTGQIHRVDVVNVPRSEVEAQASAMLASTPPAQRMLAAPPSLDEMMVGESEGSALLASMFVVQTPPHRVYPIALQPVTHTEMAAVNPASVDGEAAAQAGAMLGIGGVSVTMVSLAPTQEVATAAQEEMHAQAGAMFGSGVTVVAIAPIAPDGKGG